MKKVKDMLRKRISEENYNAVVKKFGNDKCKHITNVDYFSINDASHYAFSVIFQEGQEQVNKTVNPLKEAVFVSYYTMEDLNTVYIYIYQPKASKASDDVFRLYSLDAIKSISDFFNVFSIEAGLPCEEAFDSLSLKKEYLFISKEPISSENKQTYLLARYWPKK